MFELVGAAPRNASKFFKNVVSTVQLGPGHSFRNPPRFMSRVEPTVRDAQYEVDAVLEMYMSHPNVPPFVAHRLIQRLVTSNPSPRYVAAVARAFRTGRYQPSADVGGGGAVGTGNFGDLAATVAACLLDREARSDSLLLDPAHGLLREPLLKAKKKKPKHNRHAQHAL